MAGAILHLFLHNGHNDHPQVHWLFSQQRVEGLSPAALPLGLQALLPHPVCLLLPVPSPAVHGSGRVACGYP